jgi:hypothetical protein
MGHWIAIFLLDKTPYGGVESFEGAFRTSFGENNLDREYSEQRMGQQMSRTALYWKKRHEFR